MRYFLQLSFDGTNYHGWQYQPNGISIQEVASISLSKVLRLQVDLTGAGRTDAGVHAKMFVAHFDIDSALCGNDCSMLIKNLNGVLPPDIAIQKLFRVTDVAHARFSATARTYEYYIMRQKNPFMMAYSWYNTYKLDYGLMNQGAAMLLNHTDFSCFCKSNSQVETTFCSIGQALWEEQDGMLRFTITADRFLRNMVRAIVGTLVDLGRGRISLADVDRILRSKDRRLAGPSVPARGLFLVNIVYPESLMLDQP